MQYLLIGNPNVGKTTFYNVLTGSNQKVSNFDGVTIEYKKGTIKKTKDKLIDLPGISNLNDKDITSKTTLNAILTEQYDGIFYIADINNLFKNSYLLIDLIESGQPINLVLNMTDIYKGSIDVNKLTTNLNIPVYENNNKQCLNVQSVEFSKKGTELIYDEIIEDLIKEVLQYRNSEESKLTDRFLALQLIKENELVIKYFDNYEQLKQKIQKAEQKIIDFKKAQSISGLIFKDKREFITKEIKSAQNKDDFQKNYLGEKFDKIALHKFWGYVLFLFILWLVFYISFQFAFLGDYIEAGIVLISDVFINFLTSLSAPEVLISFFRDGFFTGIAGVLVFLPQIIILFTLLTLLEGSGYLTRVSILFEKLFNKMGLSSHSIIPLISGLGCNVLSVMSARSIKNEKRRIATILAAPFISCSARLPVYVIFINIFFKNNRALILLSLYLLGILVAIGVSYVVDKKIYKSEDEINITTLPTYKRVTFKYFFRSLSAKVKSFITKAGKLIFIGSIIVWFLLNFNFSGYTQQYDESFLYILTDGISWIFKPLGFGTPQATATIISGFFAKELVAANIPLFYQTQASALDGVLQAQYNVASAYSFMVFILLYIPCISTLGAIYSETKSYKITAYSVLISLSIAYVLSFITYNLISLFL